MSTLSNNLKNEMPSQADIKVFFNQQGRASTVDEVAWRENLLKMPAWSEDEIEALAEGRDYINRWQPHLN